MGKLTQERLKELLHYEPKTGVFYRKKSSRSALVGDIAGTRNPKDYIRITLDRKFYTAHRLAFLYMEGYFPENDIDHIDRNPSNNKWENLREVSRSCNARNCKPRSNNTSGVTGVNYYNKRRPNKPWMARIKVSNKRIILGYFATKEEAVKARWEAEVEYSYPSCNTTSTAYEYLKEQELQNKKGLRN